jgi:hypothetical protein
MSIDYFYELLEKAEYLFQEERFEDVKKTLEPLLNDDSKADLAEEQCYLRLLYVEAWIKTSDYEGAFCQELLLEAEQYCTRIDDFNTRNEFIVCIYIDFSKIYLKKCD